MASLPPMITFAAPSGTGKTTLLEGVIPHLVGRGLLVGVIKHDAHRLTLDVPGKDSWRLRQAGAKRVVVANDAQLGLFSSLDGPVSLGGIVDGFLLGVDIVLTEGFRRAGLPTVCVHRCARSPDQDWKPPENVVAWVTDVPLATGLPQLPLDDPSAVAEYLFSNWIKPVSPLPVTVVLPVGQRYPDSVLQPWVSLACSVQANGPVLAVCAPGVSAPEGVRSVVDLRPGLGPLGALLTGLAAVNTPNVLLLGPRHRALTPDRLQQVCHHPTRADVTVVATETHHDPLLARYGHRCLGAIQAALLSGEYRMDGWWGQVRVHRLLDEVG